MSVNKLSERESNFIVDLRISKNVADAINAMHCYTPKSTEWSGIIFYKINGSYSDLANMSIDVVDMLPMNIGSASYTEFDLDLTKDAVYADKYTQYVLEAEEPLEMGCIHTHHSMNTFFSGTDTDDLHENAEKMRAYLSLIVNYEMDYSKWCAKIGILGEEEISGTITTKKNIISKQKFNVFDNWVEDDDDDEVSEDVSKRNKFIYVIKCNIVRGDGDWDIDDRANYVKSKPRTYGNTAYVNNYGNATYTGYTQHTPTTTNQYTNTASQNVLKPEIVNELKAEGIKGGIFKAANIRNFLVKVYSAITKIKYGGEPIHIFKVYSSLNEKQKAKFENFATNFRSIVAKEFEIDATPEQLTLIAAEIINGFTITNKSAAPFMFNLLFDYLDEDNVVDFTTYNHYTNNALYSYTSYKELCELGNAKVMGLYQ